VFSLGLHMQFRVMCSWFDVLCLFLVNFVLGVTSTNLAITFLKKLLIIVDLDLYSKLLLSHLNGAEYEDFFKIIRFKKTKIIVVLKKF
jgi:hypothetical protein